MRFLPFFLAFVALLLGCSVPPVRTFNDQGLKEQELATVSTQEKEGLFGTSVYLKSVDGNSVRGPFDQAVYAVRVTPGNHIYEVKVHDHSLSLSGASQYLVTFEFDAMAGHEYVVNVVVDKTEVEAILGGGDLEGWIEDKTTGEKLPLNRPAQGVLGVPAADLAQGYLAAKTSVDLVKPGAFGGSGPSFALKIRGEVIDKDNADEYLAKYQKQLSAYEVAIKQRGYASIAGAYKGEATKSCASSSSFLGEALQQKIQTGVEIRQAGFEAQIVIGLKQDDREISMKNPAAIAETAIAVVDAMNSDYYFRGEIRDQIIVLKPDVSVLRTWPEWARPPSRNDLENCTVTLERL